MADTRGPHLYSTDTYEDVTAKMKDQAKALGPGGFRQVAGAHMFDSSPAFQIGVQKLDTGVPSEFKTSTEELELANERFPISNEQHAILVVDSSKRSEIAWQSGYSGMQTTLACSLIEEELRRFTDEQSAKGNVTSNSPQTWDINSFSKVYVWSMIRSMSMCMQLVDRDGARVIFMEEDFHSNRYDSYFSDDIPVQTIIEIVDHARKAAFTSGYKDLAARFDIQSAWLTVSNQRIPKKSVNSQKSQKLIPEWASSATSRAAADNDNDNEKTAYEAWFTRGIQARANLACSRHPLKSYSVEETQETWTKIVAAIEKSSPLNSVKRSTDSLGLLLSFSSRQESPIVRAIAKSRYVAADVQAFGQSPKHWAELDMKETIAFPPPLLSNGANKAAFDAFTSQAGLCYADLITAFALNRCRLREYLCGQVIAFDSLQVQAEEADAVFSRSLGTTIAIATGWTLFRKLQVMMWIVLMGIETDIVKPSEYAYTYWYAHQLGQHLVKHIQRMRASFEVINGARERPGYGYLAALELESQMSQQSCMAEMLIWIASNMIKPPKAAEHMSSETLYKLRFRMFESIGVPSMPAFAEFTEFEKQWDVKLALQGAANAAKTGRGLLGRSSGSAEGNPEIDLSSRSGMASSITVMKMITKLDAPPERIESVRETYHPYFPVPSW